MKVATERAAEIDKDALVQALGLMSQEAGGGLVDASTALAAGEAVIDANAIDRANAADIFDAIKGLAEKMAQLPN
jgi:hypothetical protein